MEHGKLNRKWWFWVTFGCLTDQCSKWLAVWLTDDGRVPITTWIGVGTWQNEGYAFGFTPPVALRWWTPLSLCCGWLVLITICRRCTPPHLSGGTSIAWGLLFGGSLANAVDRTFAAVWRGDGTWFEGRVIDWIYLDPQPLAIWPSHLRIPPFNLADVAILTGAGWITALLLMPVKDRSSPPKVPSKNSS